MDLAHKETYQLFCTQSQQTLIFQSPLWLDAVAGPKNWEVILSFKGDLLVGALPYVTNSKLGLKQITLPFLTPYLGPIINYPLDLKRDNYVSFKRKVISDLVRKIPVTDRFITQTDFNFDYWLPFHWEGYQQSTRYSYLLNTQNSESEIFKKFKPNIKKHIRNTEEQFKIQSSDSIDSLFALHQKDLRNKGVALLFSKEEFLRLDTALKGQDKRKILHAVNNEGKVICAYYLVFDHTYAHYLIGAVHENSRNSGVMSLLMWEAIKEAKKRGLHFNFEGSMTQSIERFFSSFGADLTPYMRISKVSNKWLKHFKMFDHK